MLLSRFSHDLSHYFGSSAIMILHFRTLDRTCLFVMTLLLLEWECRRFKKIQRYEDVELISKKSNVMSFLDVGCVVENK